MGGFLIAYARAIAQSAIFMRVLIRAFDLALFSL